MYEIPYYVKGIIKHTGLQEEPKDIYERLNHNGTWKTTNVEVLTPMKQYLGEVFKQKETKFNGSESRDTVPMKP